MAAFVICLFSMETGAALEKRSRSETVFLDVKGIDVKAALDQPADVLIIMLGMNDVLAPYVTDEPASCASIAAASPAKPEPMITTSTLSSQVSDTSDGFLDIDLAMTISSIQLRADRCAVVRLIMLQSAAGLNPMRDVWVDHS